MDDEIVDVCRPCLRSAEVDLEELTCCTIWVKRFCAKCGEEPADRSQGGTIHARFLPLLKREPPARRLVCG